MWYPAAGLTAALVDHGHDVRVMGPAELQDRFERAGARFRPFKRAQPPHVREAEVSDDNPLGWTRFVSGKRLAEDVLEELGSERTDVAVVDAVLSAGLAAAEKAGIPAVPLVHVLYAPLVNGPLATQWDPTRPMIEMTRRHLEIPELDPAAPVMAELWGRCPIVLACAPQTFDFPSDRLPPNRALRRTHPRRRTSASMATREREGTHQLFHDRHATGRSPAANSGRSG